MEPRAPAAGPAASLHRRRSSLGWRRVRGATPRARRRTTRGAAPWLSRTSRSSRPTRTSPSRPTRYTDRIDARFRDRAPRLVHDDKRGDLFVIDGLDKPIPMGLVAAAGKRGGGHHDVRGPLRRSAPRRLGSRGPPRRPGARRRQRRDHLPHRRHDALQPPRPRLQAGLHRRLQPVDRRVLRRASRPAPRHRPDRDALARRRHRAICETHPRARPPRRDDARQPGGGRLRLPGLRRPSTRRRSTSGCRSRSTSSRASRIRSGSAGPRSTRSCRSSAAART